MRSLLKLPCNLMFARPFIVKNVKVVGCSIVLLVAYRKLMVKRAFCQNYVAHTDRITLNTLESPSKKQNCTSWAGKIYFCFRVVIRCLFLIIIYLPLLLACPLVKLNVIARNRWWHWCFYCVQRSGPVFVKFGQWASTRRDLFSAEFCSLFGQLHTRTLAHRLSYSKELLDLTFGKEWPLFLEEISGEPCGSGCVAQVYKGTLDISKLKLCRSYYMFDIELIERMSFKDHQHNQQVIPRKLDVAVKVLHPNINRDIAIDLLLINGLARMTNILFSRAHCLDLVGCVREFEKVIEKQTDLRFEAAALKRFGKNFESHSSVKFPEAMFSSPCIIIESFEEGQQISDYIHIDDHKIKNQLAQLGANGLLKMIFTDNFVHADLHPGNILVQEFYDEPQPGFLAKWFPSFFEKPVATRQRRLIFLDTGLTVELKDKDLRNLRSLFRAVIEKDGEKVADLLLTQSPQQRCTDVLIFRKDIASLVNRALEQTVSLGQIHVSSLLSELLDVVSRHHVNLEPNFTCIVLSILVLEGLGRSLDPNLDLINCAKKFLITS